jgi:hypothetical protein
MIEIDDARIFKGRGTLLSTIATNLLMIVIFVETC